MVALLVIGMGALALRLVAVGWGLPYVDHNDEPSAANTVLGMIRRNDWNPQFFEKPSLYYYALRLVFAAQIANGLASGLYTSLADLPLGTYYYVTTPGLFVWGRALSALLGAATTVLVYFAARRPWGGMVALTASVLLAVLPFHVRHSQYMTVDVATALTTLLALWAALRLLGTSGWRAYALAGFAAGVAASTKYNAGLVVLAIGTAHLLVWGRASLRQAARLAWAALWSTAGFVVFTPYALLAPGAFVAGMLKQYGKYSIAKGGDLANRWPIAGYAQFFWNEGLLPPLCIAVLVGVALIVWRRDRAGLVLLGFVGPYLLFCVAQVEHFFRNLLPIIPALMIVGAVGIVAVAGWLAAWLRSSEPGRVGLVGALLGLVAMLPLQHTLATDALFLRPHARIRAERFLRDQVPHGAPIAAALNPLAIGQQGFVLPLEDVTEHDVGWYRAQGFRYLVANVRVHHQVYDQMRAQGQVLAAFEGEVDNRSAPHIEVLDLGFQPELLAIQRNDVQFEHGLRLLGWQHGAGDLRSGFAPLDGAEAVQAGQGLLLNLYFQVGERLPVDYTLFVHLLDANGTTVAQRDTVIRAADYPPSHWQQGELAIEMADLPLPAGLAPGQYTLQIGLYDAATMARLAIPGSQDNAVILGTVDVR